MTNDPLSIFFGRDFFSLRVSPKTYSIKLAFLTSTIKIKIKFIVFWYIFLTFLYFILYLNVDCLGPSLPLVLCSRSTIYYYAPSYKTLDILSPWMLLIYGDLVEIVNIERLPGYITSGMLTYANIYTHIILVGR